MIKKILLPFLGLLIAFKSFGQDFKKNEVKLNILNTIAIASIEVGYERFIAPNQSLDAEVFINDRFSYRSEKNGKFKTNSFKIGYNFYFDPEGVKGVYINPFFKLRTGKYEDYKQSGTVETKMGSAIIGTGVGYMFNYNDTFIIAPYITIARNFSSEVNDRFWAVEPLAGIRIGYRF